MRLMEVGTKAQSRGKRQEAYDFFEKAYDLYALFWGLQMNIIGSDTLKEDNADTESKKEEAQEVTVIKESIENISSENTGIVSERKGFMGKLGDIVRKAVDCCIE